MSEQEERRQHRERLRGATLHAERDEAAGSYLVGLEVADPYFLRVEREVAERRLKRWLAALGEMLMQVWDAEDA